MKTLATFLAGLLLCTSVAFAEGPKAVITDGNGGVPPEEVPAGEALYLSAAQSVAGDKPNSVIWIIKPKARADRAKVYGRELCIPLGTKECELVITQIAALGDEAAFAEITIKIKGEKPEPGPGPKPDDDVIPTPVDGLPAFISGKLKPLADKASIQDKFSLVALAGAYRQVADEINTGKLTTVDALLDRTKELTHKAQNDSQFKFFWEPILREIEKKVQALGDAGKLPNPKAHVPVWEEIAKGIDQSVGV
jgi:hypothetical protein